METARHHFKIKADEFENWMSQQPPNVIETQAEGKTTCFEPKVTC